MNKKCCKCLKIKNRKQFNKCSAKRDGLNSYCRACNSKKCKKEYKANKMKYNTASTKWARENPNRRWEIARDSHLQNKFGISLDDYTKMLRKQKGGCAICGKPSTKSLAVDHNHKSGKIRGLLCFKHNIGLGYFDENIQYLKTAITYIRKHNED